MKKASITEAKNNLSALIDGLKSGSPVLIVDRGRPVALLTPVPPAEGLERLRADGDVTHAASELDSLPAPIEMPRGSELPSQVLARLRADER